MYTGHPVPFHRQNTDAYCGPASVQMVLAHLHQGLVGTGQKTLYDTTSVNTLEIPASPIKWSSFPDGIATALNLHADGSRQFVLYCSRSAEDLTQLVCLAIQQTGSAPIVLFYDAKHWIVARGFTWDGDGSEDGPYQITAFYVRNPSPFLGTDDSVDHLAGDTCGSGRDDGWPEYHIKITKWYKSYVTGVQRASRWQGLFLAICAEVEIPAGFPVEVCTDAACGAACVAGEARAPSHVQDRREQTRSGPPISRDEAMRRAVAVFADDSFEIDPLWQEALAESEPAAPLLVEGRNGEPGAFYIVPFVSRDQRVPLLVMLDAATGEYEESVAMPGGTTHAYADITLRTLTSLDTVVLADTGEEVTITGLSDDPAELVFFWQPAAESRSPFWPFYEATVDDGRRIPIRIDGEAYSMLHEANA